jgi:cyclic lactone autoinducer peptide
MFTIVSTFVVAIASLFVLTGSYLLLNKPEIPAELRKE